MVHLGKNGQSYVIIDTKRSISLELTRAEAKALARFLLVELNVIEFYFRDANGKIEAGHEKDLEFQRLTAEKWAQIKKLTA